MSEAAAENLAKLVEKIATLTQQHEIALAVAHERTKSLNEARETIETLKRRIAELEAKLAEQIEHEARTRGHGGMVFR